MWTPRWLYPLPLIVTGGMVDTAPLCTPLDRYINEKGHLFQAGKWVYNPNISYQISMHIKCACLPQSVCLYVYVSVWNTLRLLFTISIFFSRSFCKYESLNYIINFNSIIFLILYSNKYHIFLGNITLIDTSSLI